MLINMYVLLQPQHWVSWGIYVRRWAVDGLGQLDDIRAVELLLGMLKDVDKYVRSSTATALGLLGDGRAVEPLLSLLEKSWHQDSSISGHSYIEEVLTTFAKSGVSKEQIVNRY